jgi:hypothetical protein
MFWITENFNGGLSTGDKRGVAGSFWYGQNLDIHSNPDQLQVGAVATKDSGSVIVDLPMFMASSGVNNDIYALGNLGNFYKKASGAWTKLRTLGGATGKGMGYFNEMVYYASGSNLGTYNPATAAFNESYQALNDADWHPMCNFLDKIIVGNGQYLLSVDASGIINSTQLTLDNDYKVKSIDVVGGGNWLLIGTERTDGTDAKLFMWDGFSTNYNDVVTIRENGINAILSSDAVVLVNAGVQGNLYQFSGSNLTSVKKIPLIEKNLTAFLYPGAVCNYQGNPLFGISGGTSLTCKRGVYSWTSAEKNYPKVLNLEYTPSHGNLTGTTRQIGSLFSEGENELYIGWRSGTDYGIDLVDGSGTATTAEYQTLIYDADSPHLIKFFSDLKITLGRALRTSEKIDVYYDLDRSGTFTQITDATIDYSVDGAVVEKSIDIKVRAREIQLKLVFTLNGNTSPAIDAIILKFSAEGKI